jgi:phage recombination protein Bet
MDNTNLAVIPQPREFSRDELQIIKDVIARGASDTELKMFVQMAQKLGLDPLSKQIHCVKRRAKLPNGEWGDAMTIVVGIDGYRLVAERTGRYCPGKAPTYEYDGNGRVTSATAYVLKLAGGAWHEVSAVAFWEEYAQLNKDGQPTAMWSKMPRLMLAKCAEALALRRAFPAELSGVYTDDEMQQASNEPAAAPAPVVIAAPTPAAPSPTKTAAPTIQPNIAVETAKAELRALGLHAKAVLEAGEVNPDQSQAIAEAMQEARIALKSDALANIRAASDALKKTLP